MSAEDLKKQVEKITQKVVDSPSQPGKLKQLLITLKLIRDQGYITDEDAQKIDAPIKHSTLD